MSGHLVVELENRSAVACSLCHRGSNGILAAKCAAADAPLPSRLWSRLQADSQGGGRIGLADLVRKVTRWASVHRGFRGKSPRVQLSRSSGLLEELSVSGAPLSCCIATSC